MCQALQDRLEMLGHPLEVSHLPREFVETVRYPAVASEDVVLPASKVVSEPIDHRDVVVEHPMEESAQDGPRPQAREVRALFETLLYVVEVRAFSAQNGDREPLLKEDVELADLHGA
jgi:hypothetical protein